MLRIHYKRILNVRPYVPQRNSLRPRDGSIEIPGWFIMNYHHQLYNHDLSNSYSIIIVNCVFWPKYNWESKRGCGVSLMSERDDLVCAFTHSLSLSLSSEWAEERLLRRQFAGFCQEKRSKSKRPKLIEPTEQPTVNHSSLLCKKLLLWNHFTKR